ncbi:MAG: family 78 glycoside hydrolase catalytic domain [Bacteroidota bacterium]
MIKVLPLIFLSLWSYVLLAVPVRAVRLTCEYKQNPMGIETSTPGLGWQMQSTGRNIMATGYQILVADDSVLLKKNIGNLWDSKMQASGQTIGIAYAGKKLEAGKQYFWKVKIWDNKNNASGWSAVSYWQMGLPYRKDWKGAKWIAYDKIADSNLAPLPVDGKKDTYKGNNILPVLRKDFAVRKQVKKATVFISGLGHFEMTINGKKIGDHFLDPGWTKYDRQALYVPFDVTDAVKKGANTIGVMLGNGFYYVPPVSGRYRKTKTAFGHPKMICHLAIEFRDGSIQNIISDGTWKTTKSPVTFSSIFGGEDYDANLEQPGWDTPGFNDKSWRQVMVVEGPPTLNAQLIDPVKVMETFTAKQISILPNKDHVFDLGQNASGIPFIKMKGHKGDTIKITPAELLNSDSSVNQKASGKPFYFEYILKGDEPEEWQPRFTYYGFRYLQVQGVVAAGESNEKKLPELIKIKGLHIRNSTKVTGQFSCSNDLFNRTFNLINWGIKSNMVSVFTDCPHREKLGWLEEAHLMGNSLQYNYDISQLGRKQLDDMRYSQTVEGLIPEIAPELVKFEWGGDMFRDSPEWGSNGIIMPWYLYHWYGDIQLLSKGYPMMQKYIQYLQTKAKGNILKQGLGDWYDVGPNPPGVSQLTPMGVTGTAIYYYDLQILSSIASLLNKPADASTYRKLAIEIKQAFNDTFFNKVTKQYATGSQTANAMAVYMNLVEPQYREAVIENIVKDIRSRNNSLTAGDIGYRYLLKVLHEAGRSDVIFDMNSRSDVPGYGYQLAKGATALTESWQAFENVSNNHFMLGHLMEWFYQGIAGINQDDSSIAFKHIIIKPEVVGEVTEAKASYQSKYGTIKSEWKKDPTSFSLHVVIPANTRATVYIPAGAQQAISENGLTIRNNKQFKIMRYENQRAVINIGSGEYHFKVQ